MHGVVPELKCPYDVDGVGPELKWLGDIDIQFCPQTPAGRSKGAATWMGWYQNLSGHMMWMGWRHGWGGTRT